MDTVQARRFKDRCEDTPTHRLPVRTTPARLNGALNGAVQTGLNLK